MTARRLVLLAVVALCWLAALMSGPALAGNAPSAWSDLWHTPDQQGQALLDAGQPAQAADRFRDPRRRGYADLEAGRYQEAAKLLAPFTDPQSEYNRGNALAKSGQLQAALAAYDAALKQAPADKDIRHNRDLVARALRQQHQSPQSSRKGQGGGQGSSSSGQQPQQSSAGQGSSSGSQSSGSQSSGSQQSGASQQSTAGGRQSAAGGQQSAANDQTASSGSQAGANQAGNPGQQQAAQGNNPQASSEPQAADANGSGSSKETPGQAQRDAALAASLARQRQRGAPGHPTQAQGSEPNDTSESASKGAGKTPDTGSLLAGGTQTPKQKPESERQLALDQWLRQIPDSPAGLLQRKFLIEHMMKQQDNGGPQESGQ